MTQSEVWNMLNFCYIAQESEKNNKVENMLDLDSISVCEECAMMCTELQYEDADEDVIVYGDQGINTEEYEKATYGDLTKTKSEDEDKVKYILLSKAQTTVGSLKGKEGNLIKVLLMKMHMLLVRVIP